MHAQVLSRGECLSNPMWGDEGCLGERNYPSKITGRNSQIDKILQKFQV